MSTVRVICANCDSPVNLRTNECACDRPGRPEAAWMIEVGDMRFPACAYCGQPANAADAARAEFRLHDDIYDELDSLTRQVQDLASTIGFLRARMEGGHQGMRDPFWIEELS